MFQKINLLGFILSFLICSGKGFTQDISLHISEKVISPVSISGSADNTFVISNDKNHIAYKQLSGHKQYAIIDGRKGKGYDSTMNIVFSPDGKKVAYAAKKGKKWIAVVNGQELNTVMGKAIIKYLLFSPDSKKLLYILKSGKKMILFVNGVAGPAFDEINENSITFSKNGQSMAYCVQKGNQQAVVFNGKISAWYQQVGFPVLSNTGKRIGFWAIDKEVAFSIIDNKKGNTYDQIFIIAFGKDDKNVAYYAKKNGKYYVIADGIQSEEYEHVHSLMFSPDGERLAYAIESHKKNEEEFNHAVIIDGKTMKTYETVVEGSFLFSADSKHFAYEVEWHDEFFVINDGAEGKRYEDIMQITMTYSPDNNRIAFAFEKDGKRHVSIDGIVSEGYDDVYAILFSPDSKNIAYAVKENNQDFVVFNNKKSKAYSNILGQGSFVFDNPNTIHFFATQGEKILRVKESFSE